MSVSGSPDHNTMSQMSKQDINICSIYSVANKNGIRFIRRMLGKPGEKKLIVVIDEAHHATMPSYKKVLDRIDKINPNRILLGLTATPLRMSEKETIELNKIFNAKERVDREKGLVSYEYIYKIDLAYLIRTGFLARPHYKYTYTEIKGDIEFELSVSDLEYFKQFGELTEELKSRLARSQTRNEIILREYLSNRNKYGKILISAINQLYAEILSNLFTEAGIKTESCSMPMGYGIMMINSGKENGYILIVQS
jgi:superfamily II DNA or RNA helicase